MCVIIIHLFMHYALYKDINFVESPPSVELIGISELSPKKVIIGIMVIIKSFDKYTLPCIK